jgi:hypothetical protein
MRRADVHGASGRLRRPVAALVFLLTVTLVGGQASLGQEPRPVNPICEYAFGRAADRVAATSPTPTVDPDADTSPAPLEDESFLDETVRLCAGVDDWEAGLALYPELLGEIDPLTFLADRCTNATAGLDAYATCVSLVIALATPEPTPVPSPSPTPAPSSTPEPDRSTTRGAFLRQYCGVADNYLRRRQQNISLVFEVYDWQSSGLLPSTLLAKFLGGAAERSRSIAKRLERVDPYAPMRDLVNLQIRLLRDEGTMLRLYAEFAREPTDAKLALAEEAREERGDTSASVTLAMLDPTIADIGC